MEIKNLYLDLMRKIRGSSEMKRMAFIDTLVDESNFRGNNPAERELLNFNLALVRGLRKKYDVRCYDGLYSGNIGNMVEDSVSNGPYSGIITHVPGRMIEPFTEDFQRVRSMPWMEMTEFIYAPALGNIESLHRKFPEARIIAYTGAGIRSVPEETLTDIGVSLVIRKNSPTGKNVKSTLLEIDGVLK